MYALILVLLWQFTMTPDRQKAIDAAAVDIKLSEGAQTIPQMHIKEYQESIVKEQQSLARKQHDTQVLIDAKKKSLGLDATWSWDTTQKKFVQKK